MSQMSRIVQGWGAAQSCAYCHGFAKIPPLIRGSDGRMHINPDFAMVKAFQVRAEPFGAVIPVGGSQDFAFTVPAEDEGLGDLLINEFRALFGPDTVRNMSLEFLSNQTSRVFQNAPVFNTLVLGNAQLNCCLPCCTLVQATNSLQVRVTNGETVPVSVSITAVGKRFLPKSEELRAKMLMYWNSIPSYPYFLTLDEQQVRVDAGAGPVTATMTVQGTGDFESKYVRTEVLPAAAGVPLVNDIQVTITEQIGRQLQSDPLPLGAFVATPTIEVAGFPGGLFRAASACHCPPASQLFKRNTKLRITFENTGASDAIVRLMYAGCFHQVPECPPGRSMDRIRSLEPTIGPLLIPQRDYCPPAPQPDYQQAEIARPYTPAAPVPPPPIPMAPVPSYQPRQPALPVGYAPTEGSTYWARGGGRVVGPATQTGYRPTLGGLGSQVQLRPGQPYYDHIAGVWRRA